VHASSKKANKGDGRWRWKRGVDAELKAAWLERYPDDAADEPVEMSSAPPPPTPLPAVFGTGPSVSWQDCVDSVNARASKYTQEQIAAAFSSAGVDPVGAESKPELWPLIVETLETVCPL
jgi:hypothetical protein